MTDEAKDEPESDGGSIAELMGYDKWPEDVSIAFDRVLGVAKRTNRRTEFVSTVADYRAIEAEFLVRIGDNEENAQQVRRRVSEHLLSMAWQKDQPFETCQRYWNDLQALGFYRIERQSWMTWFFVDSCRQHGQTDTGLAVLDPFIAELERLRADPSVTVQATKFYDQELEPLRKLRADLEAERA